MARRPTPRNGNSACCAAAPGTATTAACGRPTGWLTGRISPSPRKGGFGAPPPRPPPGAAPAFASPDRRVQWRTAGGAAELGGDLVSPGLGAARVLWGRGGEPI